jgi:hypothetical protein
MVEGYKLGRRSRKILQSEEVNSPAVLPLSSYLFLSQVSTYRTFSAFNFTVGTQERKGKVMKEDEESNTSHDAES